MMNSLRYSSLLLATSLLIACQQETPVAVVQVEPAKLSLAYPHNLTLDLTWLPRSPLEVSADRLIVFVHLLDPQGKVERTFDHAFPASWTVGEEVTYQLELYQSAIDPPVPAATYSLTIGLFEASGRRWPLQADGPEVSDMEYALAQVEVPDASRSTPKFSFSGKWWRPEETGNRQILANQWLGHPEANLVIWGIDQPGEAVLIFQIPEPSSGLQEPVPAVLVRSRCAEVRGQVSGYGAHEVRIIIDPAVTGDSCSVSFAPNFFHRVSMKSEKFSALLERASWNPRK